MGVKVIKPEVVLLNVIFINRNKFTSNKEDTGVAIAPDSVSVATEQKCTSDTPLISQQPQRPRCPFLFYDGGEFWPLLWYTIKKQMQTFPDS